MATFSKQGKYIDALIKEIELYHDQFRHIKTIFIGGGTPSSISYELQEMLLQKLSEVIDMNQVIEYSIESNPNDITKELVLLWKQYGINRVSVGVQTFDDSQLEFLNRSHRTSHIHHAINIIKTNGISNISIDLIFSLINQTIEDVKYDLDEFLTLNIDHLSYYSLILEEKTKLMYLYDKNMVELNSEDLESEMYHLIIDTLAANGYKQYEISNFTRNNKESLHNKTYWTNKEYLGIGSGAHSLVQNERFFNIANVTKYTNKINNSEEYRTSYERDEFYEECIMGLRLLDGIDIEVIDSKYGINLLEQIPTLKEYIEEGYLEINNKRLRFTRKGLMIGNVIFGLFMEGS
jgi:oxygen-independent coproporphyrinogen-3 oxidase